MLSTVLREYLERYAGSEYAFTHTMSRRGDRIYVFKLMEKSSLKYYYSIVRSIRNTKYSIEYADGTKKMIWNNLLSDKWVFDDTIKDREELKKLDFFKCANMEVVDILHSSEHFDHGPSDDVGHIVDHHILVSTYSGLDKMINKDLDKRICIYLNNKKIE